jgi:DNA-binding response OmpR family regulator
MKVLIVDDDLDLLRLIGFALRQAGYLVIDASDGLKALEVFDREQPDLVILDVNLPGLNGFEVCHRIRERSTTPVMMLTVRGTEEDEVQGLDQGADDYLTKPFSPRSLLARVRALLRRGDTPGTEGEIRDRSINVGDLALDSENQSVSVRGATPIRLTNLEFRLMQYLLVNAEHTVTTERLTSHVWGYQGMGDRQALKQLIHRLRRKIETDPAEPHYIATVAGLGYILHAPLNTKDAAGL